MEGVADRPVPISLFLTKLGLALRKRRMSEDPQPQTSEDALGNTDQRIANNGDNVEPSESSDAEATLSALNDFLSGALADLAILDSRDDAIRRVVAAELLVVMAGSHKETAGSDYPQSSSPPDDPSNTDHEEHDVRQLQQSVTPHGLPASRPQSHQGEQSGVQEQGQTQQRARQLFIDQGYLDEAISSLRAADSADERAAAARTLGIVGSQRGTAPLIAALFDDAPEVRAAAEQALGQIADPSVSIGPMSTFINGDIDYGAPYVVRPPEAEPAKVEEAGVTTAAAATVSQGEEQESSSEQPLDVVTEPADALPEPDPIKKEIDELERRLVVAVAARKEAETEALVRAEQESNFRAEAATRRREDEEARKRAEEKAARRRSEDDRNLAAEQLGRVQAELEAHRLFEEEERLRLEANNLRQTAAELWRQKAEARRLAAENALREAAELYDAELKRLSSEEEELYRAIAEVAARRTEIEAERREAEAQVRQLEEEKGQLSAAQTALSAEAESLREAENHNRAEQELLRQQAEAMRRVADEIAAHWNELETEKLRAEVESEQLREAQARMQAAEETRRRAEAERLQLEAELAQQVETEQRLLEEIRRRTAGEQERLDEASRKRVEEQDRRLAELEAFREETEIEAQQGAEKERQLNSEIESLRTAEREARTRIEAVEALRHRAAETHHLALEKVQRIEAEARRQTMEDQRVLDKLEEVRRNLVLEAQGRADQEEHLKEEIESLQTLEREERKRIAEAMSMRADAETRLHRERARLKLEEEALAKTESQIDFLVDHEESAAVEGAEWHDDSAAGVAAAAFEQTPIVTDGSPALGSLEAFMTELRSEDPYERMAALAGLARLGDREAFSLIAYCFEDPSVQVRNAAARALRELEPERTVESFTRAVEEGPPERARNIGMAIAGSGLASEAMHNLGAESREDTYKALSLLFVMAKTGEIQPLVQAIEEREPEVCGAAIKLLNLSGQSDAAEAALQRRRE